MPTSRFAAAPALAALLLALGAGGACADQDDTFNLTPSVGWTHDNNLFRVANGAVADDIYTAGVTLSIQKRYSLQRFELEASYIDTRYRKYDYLNYNATPYRAAWYWSVTPELHGDLAFDQTESLYNFADYRADNRRNINTTKNARFSAVYDYTPTWHLLGGVSQRDYSNTQFTQGEGNNRVGSFFGGLRFTPTDNTALTYRYTRGNGDYYNRPIAIPPPLYFDTGFEDQTNALEARWVPTGRTSVDARLAYLTRTHDHFDSRNYGGTVGNVNVNWNYTGDSLLTAIVSRELASYQTINDNYTQTDRFALMPTWQLTGKTVLRLRYDYAHRDYLGAPGIFAPSGRRDVLNIGMINLEWHPVRTATISATLQTERRDSNQSLNDYNDNTFSLNAQMTF